MGGVDKQPTLHLVPATYMQVYWRERTVGRACLDRASQRETTLSHRIPGKEAGLQRSRDLRCIGVSVKGQTTSSLRGNSQSNAMAEKGHICM